MKKKIFYAVLVILFTLPLGFMGCNNAERFPISEIVNEMEFDIKLLINPDLILDYSKIIDENGELTEDFLRPWRGTQTFSLDNPTDVFFCLSEDYLRSLGFTNETFRIRRLDFQYMDTPNQTFDRYRWINRIRQRGWEDGWQVLYRQRTPLRWPVTEKGIEAQVQRALASGFLPMSEGGQWSYEVDWSYGSAVFSRNFLYRSDNAPVGLPQIPFSEVNDKFGVNLGRNSLPNDEQTRYLYSKRMPDEVKNAYWYKDQFNEIVTYGPVFYRRYEVGIQNIIDYCPHFTSNNDLRFDVLVLPAMNGFNLEFVVELSHSDMERQENLGLANATAARHTLYNFFGGIESGAILPSSGLRAAKVLERYRMNNNPR